MQSGKQRDQMVYRDLNECEDSRIFDVENMTEEERRILDKHSSRLMKETGAALLVGICIGAATWRQVNVWSGATLRNSPKFHKRLRFWMLRTSLSAGLLSIPPSVTFLWRLAEHFNQMSDEFPPGGHAIASVRPFCQSHVRTLDEHNTRSWSRRNNS
ncbi:MAG: hypothetical protein MHM6MM_004310 [Cercozoa sp. M6MM]